MHHAVTFLPLPDALLYVWQESGIAKFIAANNKGGGGNGVAASVADDAPGDDAGATATEAAQADAAEAGDEATGPLAAAAASPCKSSSRRAARDGACAAIVRPAGVAGLGGGAAQVEVPKEAAVLVSDTLGLLHRLACQFYANWDASDLLGANFDSFRLEVRL